MASPSSSDLRAEDRRGGAQVLLLFVPGIALLSFALWQRARGPIEPPSRDAPSAPQRTGHDGNVPGWSGSFELPKGAQLAARLERLHPVPERQRFDVEALGRAYPAVAAGGGEPWRLTLTAAEGGTEDSTVVVESLDRIRVPGLRPLVSPSDLANMGDPADPLSVLMAAPEGPLSLGETVTLVLWGDEPRGPVELVLPGIEGPWTLDQQVRDGSAATAAIGAVLDVRAGGAEEQR